MGFLDVFKKGLKKTRDFVSDGFNKIAANMGVFDEDMLDELEMLLVQADIGARSATWLMDKIRTHIKKTGDASREAVLNQLRVGMLEIVGKPGRLDFQKGSLNIILLVGVNGTGKTTTAGKLCSRYQKEGFRTIMGAADTFRAAAIDQLKVWGERTSTPVISHDEGSDPAAVVYDSIKAAQARKADLLILDTAGRLHNKQNLMAELAKIRRIIDREAPEAKVETLLVIDATTGQNAVVQAQVFSEVAQVSGLIITKMDGNAKGGVAIAVSQETHTPLYLAGLGEGVDDLIDFDPDSFVASLLPEA
ncbi:MAG: fused signal recognition particle receptor [Clostridiales bacterium]|jgi:fused signal recognition particle receptor|nr:signal recognition particle-docking protein FtsY [Eubacteriales bacterium]MDD3197322.1 signal recognition particle-docking protein FtsY [Eubacteriales bacterium]MDD3504014.1 signal recognition particle-docking protein FtsY [Eubacteriales bacterium]MDD4681649.1 signal recognition particle-docking protein FtsY [Eubacteriales bacterium]MDN5314296.1 fused signal recognition particle receptor [Clostridiales bacterium]